jgi:hypothetical protein
MMAGSRARCAQARQRSENALSLAFAVLFRRSYCLGIGGFGWCVPICFEVRVSQRGQRFFECERFGIGTGPGRVDSGEPVFDVSAGTRVGCWRRRFVLRPNVLNGSCIDANGEADSYRRDSDPEQGWMKTVHGACALLTASYRTILETRQQRAFDREG